MGSPGRPCPGCPVHELLQGGVEVESSRRRRAVFKTRLAGAYSSELSLAWSALLRAAAPASALAYGGALMPEDAHRRLCSAARCSYDPVDVRLPSVSLEDAPDWLIDDGRLG